MIPHFLLDEEEVQQAAEFWEPWEEPSAAEEPRSRAERLWRRLVKKAYKLRFWQPLWHNLGQFLQEGEYTREFRRQLSRHLR